MPEGVVIYLSVALGVGVSVILPLIRPLLPKPPQPGTLGAAEDATKMWMIVRPYLITAIFSLIVAVILVAFLGDNIQTWQAGFLAGYTADSTLQKITTGNR